MRHIIALILLVAGVAVIVLSCLGVLVVPGAYAKLHFAAPASSLGGLLVGAGLAVEAAAFTPAFKDVFTVLVLAVTGPVVTKPLREHRRRPVVDRAVPPDHRRDPRGHPPGRQRMRHQPLPTDAPAGGGIAAGGGWPGWVAAGGGGK